MLIGLTGRPNTGKDTCGAILSAIGWQSIAFADPLRAEICKAFDIPLQLLVERHGKELPTKWLCIGMCLDGAFLRHAAAAGHNLNEPRSPRWMMQQWGTEYRRTQRADYWLRQVRGWVLQQWAVGHRQLVITDVRMPNEVEMLRDLGGHLVRVHRPALAGQRIAAHASEQHEALIADAHIHNDSDLPGLAQEVARVVRDLTPAGVDTGAEA